jgi:hypothetical protein
MRVPGTPDAVAKTGLQAGIEKTNNNTTGKGVSGALRTDVQE